MRRSIAACSLLLIIAMPQAAFALRAEDTMAEWVKASDAERSSLLDALLAGMTTPHHGSRSAILECMNAAAEVGGHSALRIGDLVQACSEPSQPGESGDRA